MFQNKYKNKINIGLLFKRKFKRNEVRDADKMLFLEMVTAKWSINVHLERSILVRVKVSEVERSELTDSFQKKKLDYNTRTIMSFWICERLRRIQTELTVPLPSRALYDDLRLKVNPSANCIAAF